MTIRISTSSLYATSTGQLGTLQSQLARTQQQLSTDRRMLSAADDPIASARALEVTQSQSINAQFGVNRANARSLAGAGRVGADRRAQLMQDVQTTPVAAGNGANTPATAPPTPTKSKAGCEDLMAFANSADGNGGYVFSGFSSSTMPFVSTSNGVEYQGDQGQVQLQVASSRKVAINDAGNSVFMKIAERQRRLPHRAGGANSGTGKISAGRSAIRPN